MYSFSTSIVTGDCKMYRDIFIIHALLSMQFCRHFSHFFQKKISGVIKGKRRVWDLLAYLFQFFYVSINSIRFETVAGDVLKNVYIYIFLLFLLFINNSFWLCVAIANTTTRNVSANLFQLIWSSLGLQTILAAWLSFKSSVRRWQKPQCWQMLFTVYSA